MIKKLLASGIVALGLASSANANDITILSVSTPDAAAFGAGTVNGYSYYDGPVSLHVVDHTQGDVERDILAYCADLNHVLQSNVNYSFGLLTETGNGTPLSAADSNRIGRIAIAGFAAMGLPTPDGVFAAAAQLAIWSIEYGVAPSFLNEGSDPGITADFAFLDGPAFQGLGNLRATTIIPDGDWPGNTALSQQMVIGLAVGTPEPSTWGMALIGFASVGVLALRRRRGMSAA